MDWEQVAKVFKALIFSPIIGFVAGRAVVPGVQAADAKDERLYKAPEGTEPPPFYIRALLVLTCTGVSFAHGSNDGQKGMGLIMLILVGTVPTAYALNHTVDRGSVHDVCGRYRRRLRGRSRTTRTRRQARVTGSRPTRRRSSSASFPTTEFQPTTISALQQMVTVIRDEAVSYGSLGSVPQGMQTNVRNQMYLTSETMRLLPKFGPKMSDEDKKPLSNYKGFLDKSTKYIPSWVKVAVALALGLGTMVGWKRIVITVGEKIGKTHLTYAQGAAAELVAMVTILGADRFGLPVSTTHVLSSGVAGTMTANGSGLQMSTLRNIAMAWIFTLPAAALLSGVLFYVFDRLAR